MASDRKQSTIPTIQECILLILLAVLAGLLAYPVLNHWINKGEMTAQSIRSWELSD